eukprot:jgi/Mesvir1/21694/Mv04114-RA.1
MNSRDAGSETPIQIRSSLRAAIRQLRERGLYTSAKWAAELAAALLPRIEDARINENARFVPDLAKRPTSERMPMTPVTSASTRQPVRPGDVAATPVTGSRADAEGGFYVDEEEDDIYSLGKAFFDCHEYRRAASALASATDARGRFLHGYAKYLAGEQRKESEVMENAGQAGKAEAVNQELRPLVQELGPLHAAQQLDPFCTYLYGKSLKECGRKDEARDVLASAAAAFPYNWDCWMALLPLVPDLDALEALPLPHHWMVSFFRAAVLMDMQRNKEALDEYAALRETFPTSDYIACQVATAQYHLRDFDEAQAGFEALLRSDPHRLEGLDTYSNILYVKESYSQLSFLAHSAVQTDKYRLETCCIVGNYYSLKGLHEQAVAYFRRALKLNRNYLSAWTLMGHEFVEMKNTAAAIDAYRHAVDINPRDYRAWYGLGQTYEILGMPYYALYYYRRTAQLRPKDARMWCAMGQCYEHEQLAMQDAAIRCYRRAVANNDREGIALHKLATLYNLLGQVRTDWLPHTCLLPFSTAN